MSIRPSLSWSAWILVILVRPSAGAANAWKHEKAAPSGMLSAVSKKFRRVIRMPLVKQVRCLFARGA